YATNVRIHETAERQRICPIDWEQSGLGPGLIDLAALVAGGWSEEAKRALARAYHERRMRRAPSPQSADEFLVDLDYCRLPLAVQWLGWSADWSPPTDQEHDWLG